MVCVVELIQYGLEGTSITYFCPEHTISVDIGHVDASGVACSDDEPLVFINLDSKHKFARGNELIRCARCLASPAALYFQLSST